MSAAEYINRLTVQLDLNKRCLFALKSEGGETLGEQLGCDLQQHEAALHLALEDPPRPSIQPEDGATLVEEAEKLVDTTKGKTDLNTARSLLAMNIFLEQQLAFPSPLINRHHADLLQRKLAANLPATTKLLTLPDDATDQQLLQQLRCRCAIAKGRHILEYHGHPAACELLALLAAQNEPSIKAVLRLHASSKVTASPKDCSGDLELNFDVRGTYLAPPREPRPIPEVSEVDIFTLVAAAEHGIRREWDTYSFSVATEGTGPALALEVCFIVMQHLQREGRSACIIVRRHPGSAGRLTVTLAELDTAVRSMALLNTKTVRSKALQRGRDMRGDYGDVHERFDALVYGADTLYDSLGSRWRDVAVENVMSRMASSGPQLSPFNKGFGMRVKRQSNE